MIVVGGMIGLGKSSVAELLGEHFGTEVFYESVDGNPILPLFYTASDEEIAKKRYPFLLQLHFLHTRFKSIKQALYANKNVLDRSIYEDWYFCKKNLELGRISELEFSLYENLLNNMMEELEELPKKAPDVMVYLKGSFDTVINRIMKRGREYELDPELVEYYKFLWEGYDDWVMNHYKASQVLVIDMDKYDVVGNSEDAAAVCKMVEEKLAEMNNCEPSIELNVKITESVAEDEKEKVLENYNSEEYNERFKKLLTSKVEDIFSDAKVTDIKIKLKGF